MASFNKVILIGRLTKDPETRSTNSGTLVANFTVAVDRAFSKEKQTDFHNIVAWGKTAEICSNYLSKGKLVMVEGELQNRSYENKEGIKKTITEVNLRNMQMLSPKDKDGSSTVDQVKKTFKAEVVEEVVVDEFDQTDMPF